MTTHQPQSRPSFPWLPYTHFHWPTPIENCPPPPPIAEFSGLPHCPQRQKVRWPPVLHTEEKAHDDTQQWFPPSSSPPPSGRDPDTPYCYWLTPKIRENMITIQCLANSSHHQQRQRYPSSCPTPWVTDLPQRREGTSSNGLLPLPHPQPRPRYPHCDTIQGFPSFLYHPTATPSRDQDNSYPCPTGTVLLQRRMGRWLYPSMVPPPTLHSYCPQRQKPKIPSCPLLLLSYSLRRSEKTWHMIPIHAYALPPPLPAQIKVFFQPLHSTAPKEQKLMIIPHQCPPSKCPLLSLIYSKRREMIIYPSIVFSSWFAPPPPPEIFY